MKTADIVISTGRPEIYEKGTAFMWTDPHISKQLLGIHLDPDLDLGSRKRTTIVGTANWILDTQRGKGKLNILDLGCGPGLYAELFAEKGHTVTGIDISEHSIAYARRSAESKQMDITYLQADYLQADPGPGKYDLVTMIFTDFGVLDPADRDVLLRMVFRTLKKGGTFIFDVLDDRDLHKKTTPRTWEAGHQGFWRGIPYLALSESFLYPQEKVILFQHIVADDEGDIEVYRFYTHFFSQHDLAILLETHNFTDIGFRDDILPPGDMWSGDNVFFAMASK